MPRVVAKKLLNVGVIAVTFTENSPVFEMLNVCTVPLPPGATVPVNVSVVFFEGSVMPPQLMLASTAKTNAAAAMNRMRMMSFPEGRRKDCRTRWGKGARGLASAFLRRLARVEQAEAGVHQAIRLARERRRKNRVALGVARELLCEGDQFLAVAESARLGYSRFQIRHGPVHHRAHNGTWQPQPPRVPAIIRGHETTADGVARLGRLVGRRGAGFAARVGGAAGKQLPYPSQRHVSDCQQPGR